MIGKSIFIDLGSSNTRIFQGDRSVFVEPSCLVTHQNGVLAIGQQAFNLLGKESPSHQLLFPIEYGRIVDSESCELFLQAITNQKMSRSWWSRWLPQSNFAVINANASSVDRKRLLSVLEGTWGGNWQLINRGEALLRSITSQPKASAITLIVDLGGQLTEVSLLVGSELVHSVSFEWGGVALTELIQRQVWTLYQSAISWQSAEQIKRELAILPASGHSTRGKLAVRGKGVINQLGQTIIVEAIQLRPAFERMADELVERIEQFLANVPADLSNEVMESGLVLSGGSSQLHGIKDRLASSIKCPVKVMPSPQADSILGLRMIAQERTE